MTKILQLLATIKKYDDMIETYCIHTDDKKSITLVDFSSACSDEQSDNLNIIVNRLIPELYDIYGNEALIEYSGNDNKIFIRFDKFNDVVEYMKEHLSYMDLKAMYEWGVNSGISSVVNTEPVKPFSLALYEYMVKMND